MLIYNKCDYQNLRISLTTDLSAGWFFLQKIAIPDNVQYQQFSGEFSQSYGGKVQHGFQNVVLTWQNPNHLTGHKIRDYVNTAITNFGYLYLTIPANDGSKFGQKRWIDVRVIPQPVTLEEIGSFAGGVGIAYQVLTLYGNNLTVINDPATGI